jgi:predicted nucleotidyltransferase
MNKINSVVYKLLLKIKRELPVILKDNLYGIYVYGSLSYGLFRPKSSDIDCLAVTNKPLNNNEIKILKSWYDKLLKQNQAVKRLEMSYGVKSNLNSTSVTKTPKFFGQKFYKRSDSDANNPIIWLNLKNSGITLFGPDPKKFAPKITNEILKKALKNEFD